MTGFNKLVPLFLVAVVLGSVGIAVAMWTEELLVNVNVSTGEVDVKWSAWMCSDEDADPQAEGYTNEEGKDVASCSIIASGRDTEGDVVELTVDLNNTYPGYTATILLIVDNIGTVPVKLYSSSMMGVVGKPIDVYYAWPKNTTQIEPGDNSTYILRVTVLQDAEEGATYSFTWRLVFAQWNEVIGPGPMISSIN